MLNCLPFGNTSMYKSVINYRKYEEKFKQFKTIGGYRATGVTDLYQVNNMRSKHLLPKANCQPRALYIQTVWYLSTHVTFVLWYYMDAEVNI